MCQGLSVFDSEPEKSPAFQTAKSDNQKFDSPLPHSEVVYSFTGKGKRWKNLYFILEGNDAQLIYFESEKRATKPKGLIDLSVCSVYGVHDSLFGR